VAVPSVSRSHHAASVTELKNRKGDGARSPFTRGWVLLLPHHQESQMPKQKTKSGAKKRFKITGTGLVKAQQAGKRHGMIKRTNKFIRNARGTTVLFKADGENIRKYMLPNG
jgi:large subunit ribosomal protein L35